MDKQRSATPSQLTPVGFGPSSARFIPSLYGDSLAQASIPWEQALDLQEEGFLPVPTKPGAPKQLAYRDNGTRIYKQEHFATGEGLAVRTGLLRDGAFLCRLDLDSHHEGQDAASTLQYIAAELGAIYDKCAVKRSTNGRGYDIVFKSPQELVNNQPITVDGQRAGELFCKGGRVNIPTSWERGSLQALQLLTTEELRQLLAVIGYAPGGRSPALWSERVREVLPMIRDCKQLNVTRFLDRNGMPRTFQGSKQSHQIAQANWRRLQNAKQGERSEAFSGAVESLMLLATDAYGTTVEEKCQTVAAIALQFCPKANDKDYTALKDTAAIIGKCLHRDPYTSRKGNFKCPWWADSYRVADKRPCQRPRGDQEKQLAKLRGLLSKHAEGRRVEQLAGEKLTVKRLATKLKVGERTIQRYLKALEDAGEILRGQENGREGYLIITLTNAFLHTAVKIQAVSAAATNASSAATMGDKNCVGRVTGSVQKGRQIDGGLADCSAVEPLHKLYILHQSAAVSEITSKGVCPRASAGTPSNGSGPMWEDEACSDGAVGVAGGNTWEGCDDTTTASVEGTSSGVVAPLLGAASLPLPPVDLIASQEAFTTPSAATPLPALAAARARLASFTGLAGGISDDERLAIIEQALIRGDFTEARLRACTISDREQRRTSYAYVDMVWALALSELAEASQD